MFYTKEKLMIPIEIPIEKLVDGEIVVVATKSLPVIIVPEPEQVLDQIE